MEKKGKKKQKQEIFRERKKYFKKEKRIPQ
jgi:hypothetical protein